MKPIDLLRVASALLVAGCGSTTSTPSTDDAAADAAPDGGSDATADSASGSDAASGVDTGADATSTDVAIAPPGDVTWIVRGGVEQVFVTHAPIGQALELRNDSTGATFAAGLADHLGSFQFRKVTPGLYRVFAVGSKPEPYSDQVTVVAADASLPPQAFYAKQVITAGNGYITTRDGTTLAYFATLPGPIDGGPYPTIVNYSGYDPGRPGKSVVSGDLVSLCDTIPILCDAPSDASAMIAAVYGYATVSVNIRGTGCSGGAYDYFETMQLLDGYDVIEAVAAQPWVAFHKVGMTGLSYPSSTPKIFLKSWSEPLIMVTRAIFSIIF